MIVSKVGERMILELWRGIDGDRPWVGFVDVPLSHAQEIANAISLVAGER